MTDFKNIFVPFTASILDALQVIDQGGRQLALVVDAGERLLGTVTDGDIRRAILRNTSLRAPVPEIMHKDCVTARPDQSREQLLALMGDKGIHHIPVVDATGRVIGLEVLDTLLNGRMRDNWVVIMAGGLGTRLRPLTDSCPKPMLHVGGQPLLQSIIENFTRFGFRKFFLAVNYMARTIQEHFGDGSELGVTIHYILEKEKLGTAGALSLLPKDIDAPLLIINGDILTSANFSSLLDFHEHHGGQVTAVVREFKQQIPYGVARLEDVWLRSIEEKPVQTHYVLAGIYVMEPGFARDIPYGCHDMPDLLSRLIDENRPVPAFLLREYWLDIGRIEDYERANQEFATINDKS